MYGRGSGTKVIGGIVMPGVYLIEIDSHNDYGPCPCCGNVSRCVWGYVHTQQETVAAYYVNWTMNGIDTHGVNFDLVIGKWGSATDSGDRLIGSLIYNCRLYGHHLQPIDSSGRVPAATDIALRQLTASELTTGPYFRTAKDIIGCILVQDQRVPQVPDLLRSLMRSEKPWWQFW